MYWQITSKGVFIFKLLRIYFSSAVVWHMTKTAVKSRFITFDRACKVTQFIYHNRQPNKLAKQKQTTPIATAMLAHGKNP